MTKDLTTGSPLKRIIAFAIPVYLGLLFQQFYNICDTVIVGRLLGVKQLAGVGSSGALFFMVIGFCIGICSGFSIPVSQQFGAKKESEMRKFTANSYWLSLFFSVVLTIPAVVFCRQMLVWMNTPEDIIEYANTYIFIVFCGIPAMILYNILAGIYRALGDSKSPVMFLIMSSILNICLDLLTIVVFKMGVEGPALATVVSQGISGIVSWFYMKKRYKILKTTADERKPRLSYMKTLCLMGIPMGLQYSITAIGSIVLQTAVNGLGSSVVAGVTAAQRLHGFLACPIEAIGSTMAPYTGQNMGARKFDRIKRGTFVASIAGFVCAAVILVIAVLLGRFLVGLFLDVPDQEVLDYAYRFMVCTSGCYALLTLVNVVRFSIQGMGYPFIAIISGVMEMLARSLVGIVLAPIWGFTVLCFAHPLAWVFADVFLIPTFFICWNKVKNRYS